MSKKSFTGEAINKFFTHETQQEQNTQEIDEILEALQEQEEQKTPKRKQKWPRMNIAFKGNNLEYLKIMSRIDGMSITDYVNRLIKADQEVRAKDVKAALEVLKFD
mgnify:CR=1 FL=1